MKKRKLLITLLLSIVMAFSIGMFTACNGYDTTDTDNTQTTIYYLGMSVSQGVVATNTTPATQTNVSNTNAVIPANTANGSGHNNYVIAGTVANITIYLYNPDQFTITAIGLDGITKQVGAHFGWRIQHGLGGYSRVVFGVQIREESGELDKTLDFIEYLHSPRVPLNRIPEVAFTHGANDYFTEIPSNTITVNVLDVDDVPTVNVGQLFAGDALPAITTVVDGVIEWDAGQVLVAGTHSYSWTFTATGSEETIVGEVELTAVRRHRASNIIYEYYNMVGDSVIYIDGLNWRIVIPTVMYGLLITVIESRPNELGLEFSLDGITWFIYVAYYIPRIDVPHPTTLYFRLAENYRYYASNYLTRELTHI